MTERELGTEADQQSVTADAERLAAIRERLEAAPQDLRWRAPALLEDMAYLLSVAAERDAEKERADKAQRTANDRLATIKAISLVYAERDALQARIEAAKAVFADADVLDETALSMSAALAGDQSEATPEPECKCDGGQYRPEQEHPFLVHPDCPRHSTPEPEDDLPGPFVSSHLTVARRIREDYP